MNDAYYRYHGGVSGLEVGSLVLPPNRTGTMTNRSLPKYGEGRGDRVYFGTRRVAEVYAATYRLGGAGTVYRVRPIGRVEPDPEGPTGYVAPGAEVVEVVQANVTWRSIEDDRRANGYWPPWDCPCEVCRDGKRLYPDRASFLPALERSGLQELTACEHMRLTEIIYARHVALAARQREEAQDRGADQKPSGCTPA